MSYMNGHVYIVVFDGGILKVGMSRKRPDIRVANATRYAEKHFLQLEVARFISEPHFNATRTEDALIQFCNRRYSKKPFHCDEWFVSDDFGADVIAYAKSLDMSQADNSTSSLVEETSELLKSLVINIVQHGNRTMLCANDLHKIGNILREQKGLGQKQVGSYFGLASTQELIEEIQRSENLDLSDVKISKRGKEGGTWLHPILFIDMAMWYSPELKVRVIKWAIEKKIIKQPPANQLFDEAVSALEQNFPGQSPTYIFSTIDHAISSACGVGTDEDKWQRATEQQLMLRDKIQENIVLLADVCLSVPECVNKSIEKAKIKVLGKCATVTGDE